MSIQGYPWCLGILYALPIIAKLCTPIQEGRTGFFGYPCR